jgi:hypothetical protein
MWFSHLFFRQALAQAALPTRQGGKGAKEAHKSSRRSFFLKTPFSAESVVNHEDTLGKV